MRGKIFILVLLLVSWMLIDCQREEPREVSMATEKSLPPGNGIEESVVAEERSGYHYVETGKPDPFRPLLLGRERGVERGELTPLQQYSLDQLNLVGVVSGISEPKAMVEDPLGKGYIVQRGTWIGKNGGRVKEIGPDWIRVVEEYEDMLGRVRTHEVILRLTEEEGES